MTDASAGADYDETFRLMYRSHNRIPVERRKAELGVLFGAARSNNKKQQITGALLLSDDCFVQTLEGEEAAVRGLYESIARDPRHDHLELLEEHMVQDRVFARWAMAKVGGEDEPDIPLIAHVDGISPAAGRGTTPAQEAVLDVMRNAARTGSKVN